MRKVELVIKCKNRILKIPFEKLNLLDEYTENFNDRRELFHSINGSLDFGLNINDLDEMYINYHYKPLSKKHWGDEAIQKLDIMYRDDVFAVEDLMDKCMKYYKDNHARIVAYSDGINNVKHEAIMNYRVSLDNITDKEIELAVLSFFAHGSYKKYRDLYFRLIGSGYPVKTERKERIPMAVQPRFNLKDFQTDDAHLSYLQEYASKGTEEFAEVMDELSGYSLEDLSIAMQNPYYGVFDGADPTKSSETYEEDRFLLEEAAKMSIKDINEYNKGRKR